MYRQPKANKDCTDNQKQTKNVLATKKSNKKCTCTQKQTIIIPTALSKQRNYMQTSEETNTQIYKHNVKQTDDHMYLKGQNGGDTYKQISRQTKSYWRENKSQKTHQSFQ